MNIPPLPPGFEMVSDTPAPPPGFEIVGQQKAAVEPASAWDRFVQGVRDPVDAGAQMLSRIPGAGAVNRATQAVNNMPVIGPLTKALGMTPATSDQIDAGIRSRESAYKPPEGVDWARAGGNTASMLPLLAIPGGATMRGALASGVATGGASGALQPITQDKGDFWTEKGAQTGIGAAFGGLAAPIMRGAARVISPQTREPVKQLMAEGVTPTPGQIMGGVAQRVEDKLTSLPILGDAITNARQSAISDFNRAALNRAVAPIGGKVSDVGREGVDAAYTQLSNAYGALLPKLSFQADNQFAGEFARIHQMTQTLPQTEALQFERIVRDKLFNKMTPSGLMNGESLKAAESDLGREARGYMSSQSYDQRKLGEALEAVQGSLRQSLVRSNPQHAQELQRINQGYANFAVVRDAASRMGSKEGVMTPAQLSGAVRAQDKSVGHGKFARGQARMQDLSDPAVSVLGAGYPDSGSIGRLLLGGGAIGSAMVNPQIPLGLAAASVPYLPIARQGAAAMLTKRPTGAAPVADAVRRLPAGLLAPALYPLLNQ